MIDLRVGIFFKFSGIDNKMKEANALISNDFLFKFIIINVDLSICLSYNNNCDEVAH